MNRLASVAMMMAAVGVGAWLVARRRREAAYDFRGKIVLITGGSRGLGLVLARQLSEQGARVAICARDEAELGRAGDDLRQYGSDPLTVACDLTDPDQIEDMVQQVQSRLGPIDVRGIL